MAGKGSSLFSLPKLFIAIMIFAFTLWWMSPTQCPEVLSQPTMTISTTKEDDTVQTVDLNDFPEADSQAFLGAQFKVCKRPMIVTASNALYFPSLENLVGSLLNTQPASNRVKLTIIDLGMTNDQRDKAVKWCNAELINLNKENQKYLQDMDSQAWIPLGIDQIVSNKQDVCILYVDPRIEIHSSLLPIFQDMEKDGYWFAHTGKNMPKAWLGQNDPAVVPEVSTTTIGIAGNGAGFSSIITPWKSCITGGECAYDFLKADHKNLLNGLVHLQFQAAHKRDFQKDVTIHKEQKYSVTEKEDIAQDTVFYLHPATGVYSFSQYATGQCSRSVFTKPVLESGSQPSVQAATRPLTKGNYVVMAANQVVKYCFYIPVSALIWKERYGYDGIIMLIGDEHKWQTEPHLKIITKYLDIFGISYVYHINTTDTYSITLSQLARIFAAYLPELDITDDSFIITSDADLWPINRNLYKITEPNKEMLLLNSACCGGFNHGGKHYTMFPMGHIGMSKKTWKEVMNISEEKQKLPLVDMILKEGDEFFGREQLENVQHGGKGWYNDQIMISVKIGDWPGFPDKAQREVPGGLNRIDRAWWPGSFSQESVERARDAHLLHGLDNWNRVSQVLQYLIPADKFKLANEYAMEFIEAHPEPN